MVKRNSAAARSWWRSPAVLVSCAGMALAGLLACDSLLEVDPDPKTVDASREVGLEEMMIGAKTDLFQSYDSKIVWGGMLGDEFNSVGTAPSIIDFDRRRVSPAHGTGSSRERSIGGGFYPNLQRAVMQARTAQDRILGADFPNQIPAPESDSREYARASLYSGLAKTWLADLYCTVAFYGDGPEYTHVEAYALAEEDFTAAIQAAGAEEQIRQAALVGRARVRLFQGKDAEALADAQGVDPDFEIFATYSTNSFEQRNRVHFRTWDWSNWSVGLNFVDLTIDDTGIPDPRVDLALNPSPAREPTLDLYTPWKVPSASSPLRMASGDEARYIIAEIEGGQTAVDIINDIRARRGVEVEWTPSGGDPNEIRDKVIDERKRTLFLEGVRLGDIRRYLDRYGLDFWETEIPLNQPVENQTCLPMPNVERDNNPGV